MSEPLKNFFNENTLRGIAEQLTVGLPELDANQFVLECLAGMEALELVARGWHVADVMHGFLPQDFASAAKVLTMGLGEPLRADVVNGMAPFRYLPHVFYVAKYGVRHPETSLDALHTLTQHFTGEFSIRVFIEAHPELTHARLHAWAADASVHVRRLVSEGTRPRLPWATRLERFQKDPSPVLELLELLKDDPERYVQRSVANNLNDISKDNPDVTLDVCERWSKDAPPGRAWIVRHALRGLVKAGHSRALTLMGVGQEPDVQVQKKSLPAVARIGEKVTFDCELVSRGVQRQTLQVDFRVFFVKANGRTGPKVFKLERLELEPRQRHTLKGAVSFQVHTTRKPYPGKHRVELLINGRPFALGTITVVSTEP